MDGELWIPLVHATHPGTGQVGAYLDQLPRGQTIVFPTVLSSKLAGMLMRRGFQWEVRWCEEAGEEIEVFIRPGETR